MDYFFGPEPPDTPQNLADTESANSGLDSEKNTAPSKYHIDDMGNQIEHRGSKSMDVKEHSKKEKRKRRRGKNRKNSANVENIHMKESDDAGDRSSLEKDVNQSCSRPAANKYKFNNWKKSEKVAPKKDNSKRSWLDSDNDEDDAATEEDLLSPSSSCQQNSPIYSFAKIAARESNTQLDGYKNRFTDCGRRNLEALENITQEDTAESVCAMHGDGEPLNNAKLVNKEVPKIGTNVNDLNANDVDIAIIKKKRQDGTKRSRRKTEAFDFQQADGNLYTMIQNNSPKETEEPVHGSSWEIPNRLSNFISESHEMTSNSRSLFSGSISDSGMFVPSGNLNRRHSRDDSLDRIFDDDYDFEDSSDDLGCESDAESDDGRSDSEEDEGCILGDLPPEPQLGNVEYKLKLVNPTKQRFEHLVTQMKWRLREGRGEALYEIGVRDCGRVRGLPRRELRASLRTLRRMASRLGAACALLARGSLPGTRRARAEVLVRKVPDDQHNIEVRVAVMGANDAGKSTLVGVLTQGELDNGRGSARLNMFRHLHEVRTGRTSSVSHEILGFDSQGRPINYAYSELTTSEEIAERSSKLVAFIDLAGHRKYLKTTVQGLTGYSPHYAMLVVSGTAGINQMTLEHLALVVALDLPFFVVVTKIDTAPYEEVMTQLRQQLTSIGCRKVPFAVTTHDDVILAASKAPSCHAAPVFPVSSVTGRGLDLLRKFLFLLPSARGSVADRERLEQEPIEFQIDETFNVGDACGPVVGGLLKKGVLTEKTQLLIGPLDTGEFVPILVESLHRNKAPCRAVRPGQAASLGLSYRPPGLRQGMVLLGQERFTKKKILDSKITNPTSANKSVNKDIQQLVNDIEVKKQLNINANLNKMKPNTDNKVAKLSTNQYSSRFTKALSIVDETKLEERSAEVEDKEKNDITEVDCDDLLPEEDSVDPRGCFYFQANVSVLYHSTAIYPKFQSTVHIGNIRQTAVIEGILSASSVLRAGDRASVMFRFVRHPEYVRLGARVLFREGLYTKGVGRITQVFPHRPEKVDTGTC